MFIFKWLNYQMEPLWTMIAYHIMIFFFFVFWSWESIWKWVAWGEGIPLFPTRFLSFILGFRFIFLNMWSWIDPQIDYLSSSLNLEHIHIERKIARWLLAITQLYLCFLNREPLLLLTLILHDKWQLYHCSSAL